MVITHAYPKGTFKENIEKLFFRTDLLTPLHLRIESNVEYDWDNWYFMNGYGIGPSTDSGTGIWKLDFNEDIDILIN